MGLGNMSDLELRGPCECDLISIAGGLLGTLARSSAIVGCNVFVRLCWWDRVVLPAVG